MDSLFDRALNEIGQDGRFQKKFDIIYNIVLAILWPMTYMNLILVLVVVPHTCHIPEKPDGIDKLSWKSMNIPTYTDAAGKLKFESCQVFTNSSISNNTQGCEKYDYDKTWYESTIATDNNWVCDKELFVANIFAASKIGELVGSVLFGWLGDTYGRRINYILSLLFIVVGRGISLMAGASFIIFVFGCVVASFPSWGALQSVTVISMELSTPARRTLTATCRFAGWSIGLALMSTLYWWLRDWKIFFIATTVTQIPFLLFSWKMIESPRWLWIQGKNKKCVHYLKVIAKENRNVLSLETEKEILDIKPLKANDSLGTLALFSGWTLAKNTTLQLIFWVCLSLSYSVIIMSSGEKADGNPFLELVWQSLAEVPGYFIAAYLADRIGRRFTGALSFSIMATSWMFLAFRESSSNEIIRNPWMGSVVVIMNRLFTTMSYSIINIFNMELYPTCIRQSGMSLGNLFSSLGAALSPYVLYLGRRVDSRLIGVTLACTCIVGVMCNLLLPETLNKKLPETIEDAQVFGKKLPKYIPVSLKNLQDEKTNKSTKMEV